MKLGFIRFEFGIKEKSFTLSQTQPKNRANKAQWTVVATTTYVKFIDIKYSGNL